MHLCSHAHALRQPSASLFSCPAEWRSVLEVAAKRKTLSLIALLAALTPSIAAAGLIDPRAHSAANTTLENARPAVAEDPLQMRHPFNDARREIALSTLHADPKTRVMGSDLAGDTRIEGEGHLTLRMHWGIDYAYGRSASRSLLGAGGGGYSAPYKNASGGYVGYATPYRGGGINASIPLELEYRALVTHRQIRMRHEVRFKNSRNFS